MRLFSPPEAGNHPPPPQTGAVPALRRPSWRAVRGARAAGWYAVGLLVAGTFGIAVWLRDTAPSTQLKRDADADHIEATAASRQTRLEETRATLEAAVKLRPNDPLVHLRFGDLLLTTGDPAAAVPHYELAVRGLPKAIAPRLNLAVALGAIGRMREATECAESVLQIDPNNAEAKAVLASLPREDHAPPPR